MTVTFQPVFYSPTSFSSNQIKINMNAHIIKSGVNDKIGIIGIQRQTLHIKVILGQEVR